MHNHFQIPCLILVSAKIYCLVMFGFKLILKIAQKVDASYEFLRKFIFHLEETQYGKVLMLICLNAAVEIVEHNTYNQLYEKIKEYEDDRDMSYMLKEVEKYIKKKVNKLMINQAEISVKPTRISSATDLSDYINKAKTAS